MGEVGWVVWLVCGGNKRETMNLGWAEPRKRDEEKNVIQRRMRGVT